MVLGTGVLEVMPYLVVQSWYEVEDIVAGVQRANSVNSAYKKIRAIWSFGEGAGSAEVQLKQ